MVAGTDNTVVEVFAVAAIHGLEDLAQRSLSWSHIWGKTVVGVQSLVHNDPKDPGKLEKDWRPYGVGDIPIDLLSRLPVKVVRDFALLYQKVLTTPGYSWIKAGDDFKFSLRLLFLPRIQSQRFG